MIARRPLPHRPSVQLTELGFGAAVIGNLYRETPEEDALGAVEEAWRQGIRYFDTAPHYGLGLSERRLGSVLRQFPRDEYVLSTKVGRLLEPTGRTDGRDDEGFAVPYTHRRVRDYSRDGVLRSIEASLNRLGLDRIDIVLIHDPDEHWEQAVGAAAPTLSGLRDEGVIGAYGAGMNQSAMLTRFVQETDVDVVMVAGRYTLLEQPALLDLLPSALQRGVGVINVGVFNSGLLSKPRPGAGAKYNYEDAPAPLLERAQRLADACERHGTSLPAAALAFARRHPAVVSVALGMRSRAQVEHSAQLFRDPVPAELWPDLVAAGLLNPEIQPLTTPPPGPR